MPLQQEDGWPLGLQFMNGRIGGASRDVDFSGSVSFNTLFSGHETSPTDASSDLETESTGSAAFHDRSTTLGSLTGITGLLDLSSRSFRNWRQRCVRNSSKSSQKKPRARFFFSLCARSHVDSEAAGGGGGSKISSLGYFLEVERRACEAHTRNRRRRVPISYEADGVGEPDSVSDGRVAAPHGGRGEACALTVKTQPIAGPV
uniref:Uncharacterized protein At3g17950 n=1 Tax=Anthurium amnicola TaxID=1678845 RepID=A0A1D1YS61_9ARAE